VYSTHRGKPSFSYSITCRIATFDKNGLFDVNGSDRLINNGNVPREKKGIFFLFENGGEFG
jgi:hypothetical protein